MGSLSADTSSLPEGKRSAGQDLVRDLGGDGLFWWKSPDGHGPRIPWRDFASKVISLICLPPTWYSYSVLITSWLND